MGIVYISSIMAASNKSFIINYPFKLLLDTSVFFSSFFFNLHYWKALQLINRYRQNGTKERNEPGMGRSWQMLLPLWPGDKATRRLLINSRSLRCHRFPPTLLYPEVTLMSSLLSWFRCRNVINNTSLSVIIASHLRCL